MKINWLEYYDSTDPNWQLKMVAKKCLHKLRMPKYEIPSDIKLRCAISGFDIDYFLHNENLRELAKKAHDRIWMRFNCNDSDGLFEHNLFANIRQYCSKNVNDSANVHMNLAWLLSDIPLRWYIFKHSKTWDNWYTARRFKAAIRDNNYMSAYFRCQLKAMYSRQCLK